MEFQRWIRVLACSFALNTFGTTVPAQEPAQAPQLHVLAMGIDAAGTNLTSMLPTRLGADTQEFTQALHESNVVDVHLLLNESTRPLNTLVRDPFDIELDRIQKSLAPQDTLLLVVGARMYAQKGLFSADLDKYGIDLPVAHLMVLLRRLPCANVVLVFPGVMETATDISLRHYIESFPPGLGAANIDVITSTTLQNKGLHSPLLPALASGLRGLADADHDGSVTAVELNHYLSTQANASRPDALQRMDPYYNSASEWSVTPDLIGKDFTVLSRTVQARIAGEPVPNTPIAASASRGATVTEPEVTLASPVALPTTYALLFATDHYDSWPALSNPIQDAQALQAVLRDTYGVQTEVVPDPSADDIIKTLLRYISRSYAENAQLIVFFAGHGYYAEDVGVGYLATRDSRLPANDPTRRSLLSFDDIKRYVGRIPAKHVLLLMDSCFSGALDPKVADSGTRDDRVNSLYAPRPLAQVITLQMKYPTRRYITSGGKEYVTDGRPGEHSPFTRALLQTLVHDADEHGYTRWRDLQAGLEAVQPTPHWDKLDERDDLNGDIILLTPAMRSRLLAIAPAAQPAATATH